ncbi:aminotransferase class I/II-fold pyridoxal phosphate-dependent enzyme [Nocardioides sp. Kera G14]|uniref:aminotransferase class I/II-fold pyridoxal phosphate-dependent enzyme n=1 Tax=Nocardioides sp. Kera G14 TaxID=2884264 RepID=UPI001D124ABD|nr:aminotransferase class V-fold PLP-dependent enzyme [Nocardioides sp. Kera G14]UDY23305.1 aminotransferase class V-fold PLP-dependent enzyme [Nocardioides sp. Kera G14]
MHSELLDAWSRFVSRPGHPFTIPGHKQRSGEIWPELGEVNQGDVPLFGGLAPVKTAVSALATAEARTAVRWGADWCRYSTGGSTHANQVLALAVGSPGDEVLVARNAHRSVLSGLLLAGLTPRWISPAVTDGLITGITPAQLRSAVAEWPAARALFLVEPSYLGTLSDRESLIEIAHAAGLAVVVDQAWGAHLGFHPSLPPHALSLGADALVTSAHKNLPAYSQASLVLARTERLSADRLERAFDLSFTTSPAGSILASTDAAVTLLDSEIGRGLLGELVESVAAARTRLRAAGLEVPGPDTHSIDPTKLVIRLPGGGLEIEQDLIAAGLAPEQADETTLIPILTLLDRPSDIERLVEVVLRRKGTPSRPKGQSLTAEWALPPAPMTPRDAFFARTSTVPASDAIGRISAEVIAPYPPGVPVLVPGEEITASTIDLLQAAAAAGVRIAYAADPTLATFQVVEGR